MRAVWYEQTGDARAVLRCGELADLGPGLCAGVSARLGQRVWL